MKNLTILFALTLIATISPAVKADYIETHATMGVEMSDKPESVEATTHVMKAKRVGYSNLNLLSTKGQAILLVRVQSAVRLVCGPRGYSAAEKLDIERCELDATARAMPKMKQTISRANETLR